MSSWHGVTDIVTFVIGTIGIVLLPGPNSLFVLSVASGRGVRTGYQAACGVFLGDSILLALVGLGAAGLLHTHAMLFMVVKYAGAAYLGWVGVQLLRGAWSKWVTPRVLHENPAALSSTPVVQRPFRRALMISLLNPKAILFLLSFFVQFIDPAYEQPWVPFLILSTIVMVLSFVYLSTLIFTGARLAQQIGRNQRLTAALSAAVGGLFLWFGAKLATASLD